MQENDDKQNRPGGGFSNNYARFMGIAFQMIVIIGAFTFAGIKIDRAADHKIQWVTAVLSLCGVFISLYLVIKSVKEQ